MTNMAEYNPNVVSADATAAKLSDGVVDLNAIESSDPVVGCRVFTHYNGPTDQLSGLCAGMAVLDPGSTPHPPHRHPEEEFLIVASGTGIIECAGKITEVGPGAMMYCAGDVLHGITNTGKVPMTFYWSKWLAKGV
jgi:mannose-6-phosphate isomerase-like protein (cupin superfamily)